MPLVQAGEEHDEPARDEAHERARKIRPELTRGPLVRVAGGRNQAEAELVQNILLEEGVPSRVPRARGLGGPRLPRARPPRLLVPAPGGGVARRPPPARGVPAAPEGGSRRAPRRGDPGGAGGDGGPDAYPGAGDSGGAAAGRGGHGADRVGAAPGGELGGEAANHVRRQPRVEQPERRAAAARHLLEG